MPKNINNKALDNLSWNILHELYKNARISTTEIGRRVGLSSPAVADRIQKLEEQGFITGYSTTLDLDKIGLAIQALISFSGKTIKHAGMIELFNSIPEIVEWFSVTGSASMVVRVAAYSSKELEAVVEKLQKYGDTTTSLILSSSTDRRILNKVFSSKSPLQ